MAQRPVFGNSTLRRGPRSTAATAPKEAVRLGAPTYTHVKTRGWFAGTRVFGHGAPIEATPSFQGTTNPTGYVRLNPDITARGYAYASSTMAASLRPAHFTHKQHIPHVPPKSLSREANPPFLKAYGPSVNKGNSAAPEAAVFGNGPGQTVLLRANGTGHIRLSRGL